MTAQPTEILDDEGVPIVATRRCDGCTEQTLCVWVDGWVKSWRCPWCIASQWPVATEAGLADLLGLMAEMAGLITLALETRWLPETVESPEKSQEVVGGALRSHAIKQKLTLMAESSRRRL